MFSYAVVASVFCTETCKSFLRERERERAKTIQSQVAEERQTQDERAKAIQSQEAEERSASKLLGEIVAQQVTGESLE
jgi:hypothetical protein